MEMTFLPDIHVIQIDITDGLWQHNYHCMIFIAILKGGLQPLNKKGQAYAEPEMKQGVKPRRSTP